jgi:hypothetical protein
MFYDHICRKCLSADLRRSRVRNLPEALIWHLMVVYLCMKYNLRQPKPRSAAVAENASRWFEGNRG